MAAAKEIELECATVRRRENGIIEIVIATNADVTVENAQAMFAAVQDLCPAPRPVLADIRPARGAGIRTIRYAAGPEIAAMTTRLAVLVDSPVSRMLGSVFLGMWKTPHPTRLFTDEVDAIAWLLESSDEAS